MKLPTVYITPVGEVPVAMGGSAKIWKAKMCTQNGPCIPVAIKIFLLPRTEIENTIKRFNHEVNCCLRLLLPGHPHITPLFGIQNHPTIPQLIFPWYSNGSIFEYLNNHPTVDPLPLILEVASGIQFMHDRGIVHGDLKGANIMIDDTGHARIIDFGLSRILSDTQGEDIYHPSGISVYWCAPELLIEGALRTKSSDIYAFGSTILELLTGSHPYVSLSTAYSRHVAVYTGASPREYAGPLRGDVREPARVWRLLEQCWDKTERRPKIGDVRRVLEGWGSIL
ncbi:kinase-like domain-containing protein [Hysterangium stoloniferum]|nr:kinase-like domain-containing protein [Hysterangium stoloniferum]